MLKLNQVYCGDAIEVMKDIEDNSVDSIVTDPPAGISFMGKNWDKDKGGRDQWIEWLTSVMKECLRVIKPGGMMLVWSIPRTSHWTATAIENAGFEIRDKIYHIFGSGFPKSSNISKQLDKKLGKERKIAGRREHPTLKDKSKVNRQESTQYHAANPIADEWDLTEPASDEAKLFDGYGTALKPAAEEWILAMAPLDGTFAENALKHGVAGINVDGSRVRTGEDTARKPSKLKKGAIGYVRQDEPAFGGRGHSQGRWPANLILSRSENEYTLKDNVTPQQLKELAEWMDANT